jgi:hypothetical protein
MPEHVADPFEAETSGVEGTPDTAELVADEELPEVPERGMDEVPDPRPLGLIELPSLAFQDWLEAHHWWVFAIIPIMIILFLLVII